MGALADLLDEASHEKTAISRERLLHMVGAAEQTARRPTTSTADLSQMAQTIPTTQQEAFRRSMKWLATAGVTAATAGVLLRALRAARESGGREKLLSELAPDSTSLGGEQTLELPVIKKQAAVWPWLTAATLVAPTALRAAGSSVGKATEEAGESIHAGARHLFTPTESPLTHPLFLPAMTAAVAGSGLLGYKVLDRMLENRRESRAERDMARAKREFENALRGQYRESELAEQAGVKMSADVTAGKLVDALAQAHASGELASQLATLQKQAALPGDEDEGTISKWTRGAGGTGTGMYLTLLALLGTLGAAGGYSFVKSRETPRKKYEMARDILRRRMLSQPAKVTVEPTYK